MKGVALVTGAGKETGIGFEVCRQLGQLGYRVILTARKAGVARDLATLLIAEGLEVYPLDLDVAEESSISDAASRIEAEHGRLDVLINNAAGVGPYGEEASSASLEIARAVFDTTLFGSWRMIQSMLPLLRKSDQGRIVNVSSGAGSHGDPVFGLESGNSMGTSYAVSKAALNALTVKFSQELAKDKILVNAVCPGFTATFEGGEGMGARPVSEGAKSVVWAATLPDDGPSGGLYRDGKPLPW